MSNLHSRILSYLQIWHSVKGRVDRLCHRAIHNIAGKICIQTSYMHFKRVYVCLCSTVILPFVREISASPIGLSWHRRYRSLAVWLEMTSSATIWLMIQNAGRLLWSALSVSLHSGFFAFKNTMSCELS